MSAVREREPEAEAVILTEAPAPANDVVGEGHLMTRPFARLLVVQATMGLASSIFTLLPKVLAADFAATPRQIGIVMAAFGIASLIAISFVGRAVEGLGHRRALAASALLLAATAIGFSFVRGAGAPAAALRGLQGVAWSISFAAGVALVADLVPAARLAQGIGVFGAAALAMNAVGPALAEPLAERWGARAMYAFATVAAVIAAVIARRLPNASSHGRPAPARDAAFDAWSRARVYGAFVVGGLCWAVMFTFIAPFALTRDVHVVRGFFVAYTVAALVVRLLGARLADRIGPARVAFGSSIAYGGMVIVAAFAGPAHLVLVGAGFGLAHGAAYPSLMALLIGGVPPAARARVLALGNGAMNLGISSVLVVGLAAERVGYPAVFVLAGCLNVVAAVAWLRPRGDVT
ncbi:MAG TPA: MFS transporter [Polyangia bacterium]|nr:MFS transporter [Polyangia bacterium]